MSKTSNMVMVYQQKHGYAVQYAMQQVALDEYVSETQSVWTFSDRSKLYLDGKIFHETRPWE